VGDAEFQIAQCNKLDGFFLLDSNTKYINLTGKFRICRILCITLTCSVEAFMIALDKLFCSICAVSPILTCD